jgi:hypothetical protein
MVLPWRKSRKKKPVPKGWTLTPPSAPSTPSKRPVKKTPAKKSPVNNTVPQRVVPKKAAPQKAVPKKPVAARSTPPLTPATRSPLKKAAAKNAPVKKAVSKEAPVKEVPVKKAAARKSRAKKDVLPDHRLFNPISTLPEAAHTLMGLGTEIIEFPEMVTCAMVVQITHDGPGRFQFQFRGARAGDEEFEISGEGSFHGRYALNFIPRGGFKYVMVDAKSSWILHFEPLSAMKILRPEVGAQINGEGSDVIRFHADQPMRIDVSAPHTGSSTSLYGNTSRYRRCLLDVRGSYEGTLLSEPDTMALEIEMQAPWKNDTRWTLTVGEISRPVV